MNKLKRNIYAGASKESPVDSNTKNPFIKKKKEIIAKALHIATVAHDGQMRWDGSPYLFHPIRVSNKFKDPLFKATALLHDVLEDTKITAKDLEKNDIPSSVIQAVQAMTKKRTQNYLNYILRVKRNVIAREVKKADIKDNLKGSKGHRKEKYRLAIYVLSI